MKQLTVLGGGSWGTALALALAPRFSEVRQWVYEADLAARMQASRENDIFLPGFKLPVNVTVHTKLADAVVGADVVLGVTPSHHLRRIYQQAKPLLNEQMILVSATKGIENVTLLRMSEVIFQVTGYKAAVLSGPNHAEEICRR